MNSLPSELQLDLFELACVNQRGGLTILARLNSNYKALVTPLLHASLLIRSIEDVQLFTSQKIEFDLVQLIEIRSELSLESCQLLKEMIEKMINLRSVDTVTLIDSSVYSTIKESCKRLENFKITISGKRPDEEEIYLEKLCCFENLKQFEFVAEAEAGWILYDIPASMTAMLLRSPNLNLLSFDSKQGKGWSLNLFDLILSQSHSSLPTWPLKFLRMQGSSCTLGATTFESDSRTLVQFFLSFRSLEVLELGGSIARRQFELANLVDELESGERNSMFPKLRKFIGTASNAFWLGNERDGAIPLSSIVISKFEPLDDRELYLLLTSFTSHLLHLELSFSRYDPARPPLDNVLNRVFIISPALRTISLSTLSSLRYSSRSLGRATPVATEFSSLYEVIPKFQNLIHLDLPQPAVCGLPDEGDLAYFSQIFFNKMNTLQTVSFAGEEKDGRRNGSLMTRWERKVGTDGLIYAQLV